MGFLLFIFICLGVFLLVIFAKKQSSTRNTSAINTNNNQEKIQKNISVPNPETANPKDVVHFILNESSDIVKQVYNQLINKEYKIPEKLAGLFRDKINGGFIMYSKIYCQFNIEDYQVEKEDLKQYSNQYIFEVKGLQVISYQDRLRDCVVYEKVNLKKEPHNKYDSNAIKVVASSGLIGYVPRDETDELSEIMNNDYKAFIFSISDYDRIDSNVIVYYN